MYNFVVRMPPEPSVTYTTFNSDNHPRVQDNICRNETQNALIILRSNTTKKDVSKHQCEIVVKPNYRVN